VKAINRLSSSPMCPFWEKLKHKSLVYCLTILVTLNVLFSLLDARAECVFLLRDWYLVSLIFVLSDFADRSSPNKSWTSGRSFGGNRALQIGAQEVLQEERRTGDGLLREKLQVTASTASGSVNLCPSPMLRQYTDKWFLLVFSRRLKRTDFYQASARDYIVLSYKK